MKSKQLLKKYGLSNEEMGRIFGYSGGDSFRNSSKYERNVGVVCAVIERVEAVLVKKIKED